MRLLNLKKSTSISYDDYLRNPNFKFVERKDCETHSLAWLKESYESACDKYGYMPIEFALDETSKPHFAIFCSINNSFSGKKKESYFAVYTDKR